MSAPILTLTDPPRPLTPELRSDIAARRAEGHAWGTIELALRFRASTLRGAVEADPLFPAALEAARDETAWDSEADAMKRLRLLTHSDNDTVARDAAAVLLTHARERRRDATRLAVEKIRADVQRAKIEARAAAHEPEEWAAPVAFPRQTEEDRAEFRERTSLEDAVRAQKDVYLWGGAHAIGREVLPDATDPPVRIVTDDSVGKRVFWVVPAHVFEASGRGGRHILPSDLHAPAP